MDPLDLARRWMEMIRDGDEAAFDEMTTPDYLGHGPGGTGDRDAFLTWLRWYVVTFTAQKPTIRDLIAAGDKVVVRYGVESVYRGGFLDLEIAQQLGGSITVS